MSTLAANECRRQVRYDYTSDERIAKATGLAESLNRYTATENEKKRIAKDYDSRLDIIQAEIDQLNGSVLSGYELREYLCVWTYDDPRSGRKTLRKREGGEFVAEEDMSERDRQMVMEIIDAQAAQGDSADLAKPVLALAEYRMPTDAADVTLTDEQRSSFEFTDEKSAVFASWFRDMFVGISGQLLTPEDREENISAFFRNESELDVTNFAAWIDESPRPEIPGARWLTDAIEAYLRGLEIQRTATKSRRASGPGTVDIPADEGSRDDAGEDSKNNL